MMVVHLLRRPSLFRRATGARFASHAHFKTISPPTTQQIAQLADGLTLAGAPLEPPRLHELCGEWRVRQRFNIEDDPDRMGEPWAPPEFVLRDPVAQRAKTSAEELDIPLDLQRRGSFARVVHNVFDERDCASLIQRINLKGFTPALINRGGGRQQFLPHLRDGFRVIVDSSEMGSWLMEVLCPHLPDRWRKDSGEFRLAGVNKRCRFLCYVPGQDFVGHADGCYEDPSGSFSCITVQAYLNDVPSANGGATSFEFDGQKLPCQPRAGSVLLFSQDLFHEGSRLKHGLKYTLRTEVMYGP